MMTVSGSFSVCVELSETSVDGTDSRGSVLFGADELQDIRRSAADKSAAVRERSFVFIFMTMPFLSLIIRMSCADILQGIMIRISKDKIPKIGKPNIVC